MRVLPARFLTVLFEEPGIVPQVLETGITSPEVVM